MPMRSQQQRKLMYAAASKPGGAGGVSRKVAKEFVATDKPGKLPKRAPTKRAARQTMVRPGLINR